MIEVELDENTPVQAYGDEDDPGALTFVRLCPNCGRFIKADDFTSEGGNEPNATCSKCGRVRMISAGWWPTEEETK